MSDTFFVEIAGPGQVALEGFEMPPEDGDNQALAVNTMDGATLYDVAFAMVWADGDTVLNRNDAYALASCRDCRTVAVAFQVVLIVGNAHVAVPQNISAAVNYRCVRCLTLALANQLVLTVHDKPSAATVARLDALWARIQEFSQHLEGLSATQIRTRLRGYEEEIAAVVGGTRAPGTPSAAPSSSAASSGPATAPASASASTGGTATPSGATPSSTGPPSPSLSPSATISPGATASTPVSAKPST